MDPFLLNDCKSMDIKAIPSKQRPEDIFNYLLSPDSPTPDSLLSMTPMDDSRISINFTPSPPTFSIFGYGNKFKANDDDTSYEWQRKMDPPFYEPRMSGFIDGMIYDKPLLDDKQFNLLPPIEPCALPNYCMPMDKRNTLYPMQHHPGMQGNTTTSHPIPTHSMQTTRSMPTMPTNPIQSIQSNPIQSMPTNPMQIRPIQTNAIQTHAMQTNTMQSRPIPSMQTNHIQTNPIQTIQTTGIHPSPIQTIHPLQFDSLPQNDKFEESPVSPINYEFPPFPTIQSNQDQLALLTKTKKQVKPVKSAPRKFACSWKGCTKTFTTSGHLSRHERTHLNLKPYECPKCQVKFTRLDNMHQHFRLHLNPELRIIKRNQRRQKEEMKKRQQIEEEMKTIVLSEDDLNIVWNQ